MICSLIDSSSNEIISAISRCTGITFSLRWLHVNSIFWWVYALFNFSIGAEWPFIVNIIWVLVCVHGEYSLWKLFPIIISCGGWLVAHRTGIMHWTPPISIFYPSMASLWLIMLLLAILTCKWLLAFFHMNSENNDLFPKQTEQPLSM